MRERTSNILTRMDRMEGDSGTLKGYWARNTAVSDAAVSMAEACWATGAVDVQRKRPL